MNRPDIPRRVVWLAAAALIAVAAIVVLITHDDTPPPPKPNPPAATATPSPVPSVIAVDGADADQQRDQRLPLSPAARKQVEQLRDDGQGDLAGGLREPDDGPAGVIEGPLAAQELPGCRTQFVRNYSSRNGTAVREIVWHYTVSPDRPGWADNDALTAMANNPASGVSWTASIGGKDGNCSFNVPLSYKPWTQGNANPFSVGIEVIATGTEPSYVSGPGRAKLFKVTRTIAKREGIPLQRGKVTNCRVVKPGIIQHADLGACGGGHHDIGPFSMDRVLADFLAWAKPAPAGVVRRCRKIAAFRLAGRKPNRWQRARVKFVRDRGFRCGTKGKAIRAAAG